MGVVLASGRVRRILVAFAANRLGSWLGLVAMLVVVFDRTHSALAVSSLLLAWQAVPAFAVPSLVARVESSARGRELSGLYCVEAVVTAGLAILSQHFSLPVVLVLAAVDGTAALSANALLRAALAKAAREHAATVGAANAEDDDAERSANAVLNIVFSATFVAGPVLGGILVAGAGAAAALYVDVGTFLLCGLLLIDLRPHVAEAGGDSVRARVKAAWRYVYENPLLRNLLMLYAVALALFETAAPIEVTFVKSTLSAGDRGLGLLLTAWGGGAVLGSVVFARAKRKPLALLLSVGTLAIGVADLGFALSPSLGDACIAAFIGGCGNGIELPALMSLVQNVAPSNMHGRVIGGVEALTALAVAAGLALGGVLVALTSTRTAFSIVGGMTVLIAIALARPGWDRRPNAPPAEPAPS